MNSTTNTTLTATQRELVTALEARNCKANWWFGKTETRLYVERTKGPKDKAYLTFDDPANCYGAKAHEGDPNRFSMFTIRIAFYEALRIGNPTELPKYLAEVEQINAANADNYDFDPIWAGEPTAA